MKKLTAIIIILTLAFSVSACFADPGTKLGRGIMNLVGSPVEIYQGMKQAKEQGSMSDKGLTFLGGWDSALTWGIINGVGRMAVRAIAGAYEIVTFPIPYPKDYAPVINELGQNDIFLK